MKYSKAGCENPASSQRSEVLGTKHVMPSAAMPGSLKRKFPEQKKAGQAVAGSTNNMVEISFKSKSPGKQTWKGSSEGFTTRKMPEFKPAWDSKFHSGGARQNVKGK